MATTILVVDDDEDFVSKFARLLKRQGFNVLPAHSGKEAVEFIKSKQIDVVLLDWILPGDDGIKVLEKIRSQDKEVAVIMISGYGDNDLIVRAIKNGASDYISKPIGPKKTKVLIEKIARYSKTKSSDLPFFKAFQRKWASTKKALSKESNPKNNKEKGKTLEELAAFVLGNIDDGIKVDRRKNIRTYSDEIDLYVINESEDLFWHDIFGPKFIVECKNWKRPVSSRDVLAFFGLLHLNDLQTGIFFTTSRITGNTRKDAGLVLRDCRNAGTHIIVIDGKCLEEIAKGTHPSVIVRNKYHELCQI